MRAAVGVYGITGKKTDMADRDSPTTPPGTSGPLFRAAVGLENNPLGERSHAAYWQEAWAPGEEAWFEYHCLEKQVLQDVYLHRF